MKSTRMTKQKQWILEALCHRPLSADQLFTKLHKSSRHMDLTTIYRNLEVLSRTGTVCETHFSDGIARFELQEGKNHHHHVICSSCGEIEDIELDEHVLARAITKKPRIAIVRHTLEFFGVCRSCSKVNE